MGSKRFILWVATGISTVIGTRGLRVIVTGLEQIRLVTVLVLSVLAPEGGDQYWE